MLLAHAFGVEFLPRCLAIRSPLTEKQYRIALSDFERFLRREPTIADLDDDVFTAFLKWLVARPMSPKTANERMGRLKTLWTWLARRRVVERFPTVGRLPEPEKCPLAWRQEELAALFDACKRMPGQIDQFKASDWWLALHAFLWNTAERIGATMAMEWKHVDLKTGVVVLPGYIRKGGLKQAVYHLWPETITLLTVLKRPRGVVFPWDRHPSWFYGHYNRLLKLAGLPNGRECKAHRMRVSHATWRVVLGGDATKALGHADRSTTVDHYLDQRLIATDESGLFKPWQSEAG